MYRISTLEQNARLPTDALKTAGCYRVFTGRASGSLDERVALTRLFDRVRPGDAVVVWRLDRLGRSLRHLSETVNALSARKVGSAGLTENIDTTSSGRELVFIGERSQRSNDEAYGRSWSSVPESGVRPAGSCWRAGGCLASIWHPGRGAASDPWGSVGVSSDCRG